MTIPQIEKRLSALENEVARLKRKLKSRQKPAEPWWKRVSGVFADSKAFDAAMELGRKHRESFTSSGTRFRSERARAGARQEDGT